MKQLSKEQKIRAFDYAYFIVLADGHHPFVCNSLYEYINTKILRKNFVIKAQLPGLFPEFFKGHRVDCYMPFWGINSSGNLSRLRAIERAIQLVEKSK